MTRTAPLALVAASAVFVAVLAMWTTRGAMFYSDDWNILFEYRDQSWFEPFRGHLSVVPVALYQIAFALFGWDVTPLRLIAVVLHAAIGVAAFVLVRPSLSNRLGAGAGPWAAAVVALWLTWQSTAHLNVVFPYLVNFSIPMLVMVVNAVLLDSDRPVARVAVPLLLALALACSALGTIAVVVVVTQLAVERRALVRWWLPVGGVAAAWGVWWLALGGTDDPSPSLGQIREFAWRLGWGTFEALGAGVAAIGVLVALAAAVVITLGVRASWSSDASVLRWVVGGVAYAAVLTAARAGSDQFISGDASWYLVTGGFFVLLAVAESVAVIDPDRRPPRWVAPAAAVAVLVLVVANAAVLVDNVREHGAAMRNGWTNVRVWLRSTEVLGERADRDRVLPLNFNPVTVGQYLDVVAAEGSPVAAPLDLDEVAAGDRASADAVFVDEAGVTITPGACVPTEGVAAADTLEISGPATVAVRRPPGAVISVLRFSRDPSRVPPVGTDVAGDELLVTLPGDGSDVPWLVAVPGGQVSRC